MHGAGYKLVDNSIGNCKQQKVGKITWYTRLIALFIAFGCGSLLTLSAQLLAGGSAISYDDEASPFSQVFRFHSQLPQPCFC